MEIVAAHAPAPIALAVAAGSVGLAWFVGRSLARRLPGLARTETFAASVLIGSGILATLALMLGRLHALQPASFLTAAIALGLLGAWSLRSSCLPGASSRPRAHEAVPRFLTIAAIAFVPLLVSALEPPQFVDACNYHLPLIDHYARGGALELATDQQLPTFGIAFHLLAVVPYQLGGETAVQLLHLAFFVLGGLVLLGAGERIGEPFVGILAAALWWGQPTFASNATQALVDGVWPAFVAMAISLAMPDDARAKSSRFALAGFLAGSAIAIKYTGAIATLPLAVLAARTAWRERSYTPLLASGAGVVLGCGPVLLWNSLATGDPLFPYLLEVLPNPFWDEIDLASQRATWRQHGAGHGLLDVLLLPWRLVVEPGCFLTTAPLSPLLPWFLLPLALPATVRTRNGCLLLLTVLVGCAVWFTQSQQSRFLSGVVLATAWIAAAGTPAWLRRPDVLSVLAYASLALVPLLGAVRLGRNGAPPLTAAARDERILAREPAIEVLWSLAATRPGARVYALFGQDLRHAACAGRALSLIGDWFGTGRFREVWDSERRTLRSSLATLDAHRVDHLYVRHDRAHPVDLRSELGTTPSASATRLRCLHADEHGVLFRLLPRASIPVGKPLEVAIEALVPTIPGTTWSLRSDRAATDTSLPTLEFVDAKGETLQVARGGHAVGDQRVLAATAPARAVGVRVRHAPDDASLSSLPPID